ncbi:MAG: M20/M25/M40 family metallo-hydrolase [Gammaproteobacteria bacterium]|jgi:acetylornithine deacetylase/succinyl-diaminopimelate desuccinylase-like protein|nr:M20/M25/M40 family metallo-hydrolase [Gammaproteobacteria bacterium]
MPISRILFRALISTFLCFFSLTVTSAEPDWDAINQETLEHFQAMLQIDTSNPPGNETVLVEHIAEILSAEGIDVEIYSNDPDRANLVARIRGNGSKQPLLLMAHLDVVTVDPEKWSFPPFGGTLNEEWIYGRGAVDDKDNLVASMMTMLMLKRNEIELDRDVIFLAEAGEEGGVQFGVEFMTRENFEAIDAEYCLAEGGSVVRAGGEALYTGVQTGEKKRRTAVLTVNGIAGHGSIPTRNNAVVLLGQAITALAEWQEPIRLSDTTTTMLARLADISSPESAARYRALLNPGSAAAEEAMLYLLDNEPGTAALLHNTVTPTIVNIGYRYNVIPSAGTASIDVRLLPDEDFDSFLDAIATVIDDPAIEVSWDDGLVRPSAAVQLDTEAFQVIEQVYGEHYGVPIIPRMSTGATDMSYVRAKGVSCYGIGPGIDREDVPLGYGAHSDQERILEQELYLFVQAYHEIVVRLAAQQ